MKNQGIIKITGSTSKMELAHKGYVRKIRYHVEDGHSQRSTGSTVIHTQHSMRRAQQRGINRRAILLAVTHGTCVMKQGFTFHVVRDRDIPAHLGQKDRKLMKHLVVMMDENDSELITCYRSRKGVRHVNRKPKYLLKRA